MLKEPDSVRRAPVVRFQVIGVAGTISRGNNDFDNQRVYIPLTTMLELFPLTGENIPQDAVTSLQYQPTVKNESQPAVQEVHAIVARNHGFDPNAPDAFEEWDSVNSQRMVGKIFDAMDIFLGGVGLVTLTLGAIGVVNIMLVAVSERTREIGLRKALGATNRSILLQFFLEGAFLTLMSGAVGMGGNHRHIVLAGVGQGGDFLQRPLIPIPGDLGHRQKTALERRAIGRLPPGNHGIERRARCPFAGYLEENLVECPKHRTFSSPPMCLKVSGRPFNWRQAI